VQLHAHNSLTHDAGDLKGPAESTFASQVAAEQLCHLVPVEFGFVCTFYSSSYYYFSSYYYYYKRQSYPAVSEASRTGYKNYNVNTQTGPRKADTITYYMIHIEQMGF